MNDVMLDLETLSSGRDACIVSIGALQFDLQTGKTGSTFHLYLDLDQPGSLISPSTVAWWSKLPDETRAQLYAEHRHPLREALRGFNTFYHNTCKGKTLWSNGPTFDERVIREAYDRIKVEPLFHWRDSRCCRTIRDLAQRLGWAPAQRGSERGEGAHDAIADCRYQVQWVCDAWRFIHDHTP